MPMSRSTSRAKRASTLAGIMPWTRCVPERSRKASSIDSGSTSGVSACMAWRTSRPTLTYFAMSGRTTVACGQSVQRLEHRHRRAHAIGARDVAGRRHHAALAAADDHGLVGDLGVVAFLHRGVKRVAIDMRERQLRQRVMADEARGAAGRAAPRLAVEIGKAIPAKAGRRRQSLPPARSRHVALPPRDRRAPGARRRCWSGAIRSLSRTPSPWRRRAARNRARSRGIADRWRPRAGFRGPTPVSARNAPSRWDRPQ